MATTQYKDNAEHIYEFQQEPGDAGGAEKRPVAGMPAQVRTQLANMAAALISLSGAVLDGVLKVTIQAGSAVIGKLAPNVGVNIGTVDVASGSFAVTGSLPTGTNHIGSVTVATALPAGANTIGKVDAISLPALGQLPATLGDKPSASSLSVVMATDHSARPVSITTQLPPGTNNIGDVDIASMPPLPAGNNNIGDVDIASLPPVTVTGSLPAGANTIGKVDVVSLPAIGQLPTSVGAKASAASLSMVMATDQVAVPTKTEVAADYDSGAGNQNVSMRGIALPAAGGAVAGGTLTAPLRVDPTGTTVQPISGAVSLSAALPAGNNNIGDVDVATLPTLPQLPATIGQKPKATSLGVAIASDQIVPVTTAQLPVTLGRTDSPSSLSVVLASDQPSVSVNTPQLPGVIGPATKAASLSVTVATDQPAVPVSLGAQLPAGFNNIGDVDVATMPPVTLTALPAGNNNIGDVDIASLPTLPQLPATIGPKSGSASLSVVQATGTMDRVDIVSGPPGGMGSVSVVPASVTVVTLAAFNSIRIGLLIVNNSVSAMLYVKFGAGASLASWSVIIQPGGTYEMLPRYCADVVTGIWSAAVGDAHVTEIS